MVKKALAKLLFLSTPSVGRATWGAPSPHISGKFLSTPSVGRATITSFCYLHCNTLFLSTPSVGRATLLLALNFSTPAYFYPRPPWGGRRVIVRLPPVQYTISIHALRGEGDRATWRKQSTCGNFYPRPPWGGRQLPACVKVSTNVFLSTPSVGRATRQAIHTNNALDHFYPRPPWGGRQQKCLKNSCTFVSNHTIDSLYTEKFCLNYKETGRIISVLPLRFGATRRDSLCELAVRTGSITTVKYHLAPMREKRPAVPPCFYTGFPAGKNAGCPVPDRSIRPAVL